MNELAIRFNYSIVTIERRLAELRASDPQFSDNRRHDRAWRRPASSSAWDQTGSFFSKSEPSE
jgi:hypothetical protein